MAHVSESNAARTILQNLARQPELYGRWTDVEWCQIWNELVEIAASVSVDGQSRNIDRTWWPLLGHHLRGNPLVNG